MAGFFFAAGVLVGGFCMLRLNIRILRTMGAWQRRRKPEPISDFITAELERIRLRNTIPLEIIGMTIGVATAMIATRFLQ